MNESIDVCDKLQLLIVLKGINNEFNVTEELTGLIAITLFRTKRDHVTGDWRKLHNEELHNMYSSPNIIRMIKSRRMRWAGHGGD
jgi:hypothetical protein